MLRLRHVSILFFTVVTACGGKDAQTPAPTPKTFELLGTWGSSFGGTFTITAERWGLETLVEFDNDANVAFTQNPADDAFNPSKFNKVVWTEPMSGRFFYCTVDFGLATLAEAKASAKTADAASPSTAGCGGFSWSEALPPFELEGEWADNFGGLTNITHATWGTQKLIEFDNAANWAVTQNAATDQWNPSKFNKVVWTERANDRFFVCIVDFGLDTAAAAKASAKTADASNPSASGCGMFSWTAHFPPLEVAGAWFTSFASGETITSTAWTGAAVIEFDNAANVAYTQNSATDPWNPSKFSKLVWTEPSGGRFFYCVVDFGLDTLAAAKATSKTADASNPSASGCGMFSWTGMRPAIEVRGTWTSNFGGTETISIEKWATSKIVDFDADANFAITQFPSDDMFNPDKFAKIVWTPIQSDEFYYCMVDFGRATAAEARTSTKTADATNPGMSGCGGFSWTKLTRSR